MHVRIDETWNEEKTAPVDVCRIRASHEVRSDLPNPTVAYHNHGMRQWRAALGRDESHILYHDAVVHDVLSDRRSGWGLAERKAEPYRLYKTIRLINSMVQYICRPIS